MKFLLSFLIYISLHSASSSLFGQLDSRRQISRDSRETFIPAGHGSLELRVPPNTIDFFPNIKDNLTKVTWAHAVNNASYLTQVLQNGGIMMIEADVVLGTLINDPSGITQPIMGHPPSKTSDISLKDFLQKINAANTNKSAMKGVKLDFKSIEVFEESLGTVETLYDEVNYPVWINADILPGPINSMGKPVDAERFLNACKKYPAAMLSTGWTTLYGGILNNGAYTDKQIDMMIQVLKSTNISKQAVTFPVRAGLAANSFTQMEELLSRTSHLQSTLTIWSSAADFVNIPRLRELILKCRLNRVYLDVPEDISSQLNL